MAQTLDVTLSDESVHTVRTTLIDKVAAETYFRNHKHLGTVGDNPFRSLAFMAWSALKRQGLAVEWDQFLEGRDPNELHCLDVEIHRGVVIDPATEVEGLGEGIPAGHLPS
ncbi:hypothetical protein [Microbacterium sp. KNMS]